MQTIKYESKIMGINLYWISAFLVGVFILVCFTGGNLVNWGFLGFEVLFPFYIAIAVGEWGKTRSDPTFEIIAAQTKSLFRWTLNRYLYLFVVISAFVIIGMLVVQTSISVPFGELLFVYLSTAFFLSSLAMCCSFLSRSAYTATAVCGIVWIFTLLVTALLRIPFVQYIYLFIRFAAEENTIWILNKCILIIASIGMWAAIWLICKKRKILSL